MTERVTSADGTPIAYWECGDGPPLVAVHGATQDHEGFAPIVPLLEARFRVFTLDRRGRGGSGDTAEYAIEREYEDVAAVVDAVAERTGQPVFLYGFSYGATCALGASLRTTNHHRLALYEPSFREGFDYTEVHYRVRALCAEGRGEEALEVILRDAAGLTDEQIGMVRALPTWPERVATVAVAVRELAVLATLSFDAEAYRTMRVPTLLLIGERSGPGEQQIMKAIAAGLPDCEQVVLPGQSHFAQVQAPQMVVDELVRWQSKVSTSTGS